MLIKKTPRWALSERHITPESLYLSRRQILKSSGIMAGVIAGGALLLSGCEQASTEEDGNSDAGSNAGGVGGDPSAKLYPVGRNEAYNVDRPLTEEGLATSYNNFYEFGSHKQIAERAQDLPIRPWQVRITGDVQKEMTLDIDDLLAKMPLEERVYRHRCVETWSMVVPWSGFALKELVSLAQPLSSARYVRMETFKDPKVAGGQKQSWYPWPYVEGLTIEEATNDLAFIATGLYGKPIPKQNGAPLRLAVPWKYGFKSIKSIVEFRFASEKPNSFWEEVAGKEYGFWANVNPDVAHRRWSQAMEQPLGSPVKIPTLLYNGYAEEVASLYAGMNQKNLFY